MMKICKILLVLLLVGSSYVYGGPYKYEKGNIICEIEETDTQYIVVTGSQSTISDSRNQNILERRLRLNAVDVIGAYILYKDFATQNGLTSDYFQVYADGVNLHYNAILVDLKQERIIRNDKVLFKYICNKSDYDIRSATYQPNINLYSLLVRHYQQQRNEYSAHLLCGYPQSTAKDYINVARDFYIGDSQIPAAIRQLQVSPDRLEESLYGTGNIDLKSIVSEVVSSMPASHPYRELCYAMLVSSAPLKDKEKFYNTWCQEIKAVGNIWTDILSFCATKCASPRLSEMSISETIAAFPGAIAPHTIRYATYEPTFEAATQHYANSRFKESAQMLIESIDMNGIAPRTLNLLGASYRLDGNPTMAMPYLLLGFIIEPEAQYIVGNLALCLHQLKYPDIEQAIDFLSYYAKDAWSQEQLRAIK